MGEGGQWRGPHPAPHFYPSGTCVPGPGQVLAWQDFLQSLLDSLFFRELRYLLLIVLGPESTASSTVGLSHGPVGEGGLHPGW